LDFRVHHFLEVVLATAVKLAPSALSTQMKLPSWKESANSTCQINNVFDSVFRRR
jgi:hypothetical protein